MGQSNIFITILPILFFLLFILFFFIFRRIYSKKLGQTPRELQRFNKKLFYILMPLYLFMIFYGVHQHRYGFVLMGIVFVLITLSRIYQRQTDNDTKINYACDPGHCGRCEYDLTGNVSGVCPECGWEIPKEPVQYERPDWACWWKQWSIDYLEDWRRTRNSVVFWMVAFAALGIGLFLYTKNYYAPIFAFIMSLTFAINLIRIVAYGKRQG